MPGFPDIRSADARALVTGFLHREADGGWLPPDKTADLLHCYGISLVDAEPADTGGTEVRIGVTDDRVFGPLVILGPGGRAARLTAADRHGRGWADPLGPGRAAAARTGRSAGH